MKCRFCEEDVAALAGGRCLPCWNLAEAINTGQPVRKSEASYDLAAAHERADVRAELTKLRSRRATYIQYAKDRIDDEDWHGCSDAANDLRELDVEIRMLEAQLRG